MNTLKVASFVVFLIITVEASHYSGPYVFDPRENSILCYKWSPVTFTQEHHQNTALLPCYSEVSLDAISKKLILTATRMVPNLGCIVRLPKNVIVTALKFDFENTSFSSATVYSGTSCRHIINTPYNLSEGDRIVGPLQGQYNIIHFWPLNIRDKLIFRIEKNLIEEY